MMTSLNNILLRLPKRAESGLRDDLIKTFVDVGPLSTLLSSVDHQVIYGRRGTGKTHALAYLAGRQDARGDVTAYVDLRNIGSSGGLYADYSRPISERATSLLVDTLVAIHDSLLRFFVSHPEDPDLSQTGPALDALAHAITQVQVVGTIESEEKAQASQASTNQMGAKVSVSGAGELSLTAEDRTNQQYEARFKRMGTERLHINFGSVGSAFRRIASLLQPKRLWILLDEWSSLPPDLQPYLADLLRRSLLSVTGISVKIAAIEHRTRFQIPYEIGGYLGLEVGADIAADINLDDFMVFDNDSDRAKAFFQDLLFRHARSVAAESGDLETVPEDPVQLVRLAFTQVRVFEEFVRASEGVPRDAINLLSLAAQRAIDAPISTEDLRVAARNWYQRDKERAVSANAAANQLLHYIIDTVIGERRARAFLLRSGATHPLIDILYDARVLHILKRNISTHDQPGVRYDVYKLDYGCYVDLMATQRAPLGLLPADSEPNGAEYIDVPPDDYRAIRRAILNLDQFEHKVADG
jgi:hypothetical protein